MAPYVGQECPFVDSESIGAAGVALGRLRASVKDTYLEVVRSRTSQPVDPGFRMFLGVLMRMLECSLSLEILISKGRHRDAATLLTTMMELRLDLQYVAGDSSLVQEWVNNAERGRKPWRVTKQIETLFRGNERAAELEIYRELCMIKHGNPASGSAGFALAFEDGAMSIADRRLGESLSVAYLFAAGSNLKEAFEAALRLTDVTKVDLALVREAVEANMRRLNAVNTRHVYETLRSWSVRAAESKAQR